MDLFNNLSIRDRLKEEEELLINGLSLNHGEEQPTPGYRHEYGMTDEDISMQDIEPEDGTYTNYINPSQVDMNLSFIPYSSSGSIPVPDSDVLSVEMRDVDFENEVERQYAETEANTTDMVAGNESSFIENVTDFLNPTALGAKVATNTRIHNHDRILEEENESEIGNVIPNKDYDYEYDLVDYIGNDTQKTMGSYNYFNSNGFVPNLHQVNIHHHYYGNFNSNNHNTATINANNEPSNNKEQDLKKHKKPYLPSPWSIDSEYEQPVAKTRYLLSSYLQLTFNTIAMAYGLYLVHGIIQTIRFDIKNTMEDYSRRTIIDSSICRRQYEENLCDPSTVVPAMEKQCGEWEKCMNQNPYTKNGHARISAETMGMILNSLVEPIGLKSFLFLLSFIAFCYICNFSLGFLRAKTYYGGNGHEQLGIKKIQGLEKATNNTVDGGHMVRYGR